MGLLCMRGRRWRGRVPLVSSLRATSPLVYQVVAFSPHVMPSFPTLAKPLQSCWLPSVSCPWSVPDALTSPLPSRSIANQWRSSTEASPVLGAATTYVAPSFVPHFSLVRGLLRSPLLHDWECQEEAIVCGSLNVHSGSKASFVLWGITIHVVCC